MTKYRKGFRAEHKAKKLLESQGYTCVRSAGSHGLFDIIAVNSHGIKGVQVKSGKKLLSSDEREAIKALKVPENMTKEYWHYTDFARSPVIEVL